jgi:hypothetical protein
MGDHTPGKWKIQEPNLFILTDQGKEVLQKAIHLVEKTHDNFFSVIRNKEDFNQELLALARNWY